MKILRHLLLIFPLVFLTASQVHTNQYAPLLKLSERLLSERAQKEWVLEEYQVCTVPNLGAFYIDDIPDGIKDHLRKGIYWESGIGEYVRKYTRPNTIAIDLGAHIGIHTLSMSRKVGPNGLVVAFEPQSKMIQELLHNLKLNRCEKNVALLPVAVGDSSGVVELDPPDLFNEGGTAVGSGGEKVQMITLDSLNLRNVSFIKMDVERYELNVLNGARETMKRNRPVVVLEILAGEDPYHCSPESMVIFKEIQAYFSSLNYRLELIYGNDFLAQPIEKIALFKGSISQGY